MELEGKRVSANKQAQSRSGDIMELEHKVARIEQKKLAAEMEEKQILDKLWENYELSHSAACNLRQPVENLAKANRHIAELRRSIAALGTPNIGAIEEYERVNSRYEFLTEQRSDVDKAKAELLGIIREITSQMEEVFVERFKQIDEAFRQTFLELFGGGKAELILTDPDNVLESGIEISVAPPGKVIKNLISLSGGEQSFVAIAIYFAILCLRPAPFCILDEIDAALDEVNVRKYAMYLKNFVDTTQFILGTHRRGTMERANVLYGVTMQQNGVSKLLKMNQVDIPDEM
jgi:chromosome segregation protein